METNHGGAGRRPGFRSHHGPAFSPKPFFTWREHGRGPKAPDVVPGWPTGSSITRESGSMDRNGLWSVNPVQRRARKRALRWTLLIVYRRRERRRRRLRRRRRSALADLSRLRPDLLCPHSILVFGGQGLPFGLWVPGRERRARCRLGARPASSHRRAAPSQREGAGRRGDGIRRGFRPSGSFFFYSCLVLSTAGELGQ